jgi:formylglycine-generating enzyme required for sulfatase activity
MDWDIDQAGIFFAISYIGLLDEFAIFNRPLTADEVGALQKKPGLLQPLKKAGLDPAELQKQREAFRREMKAIRRYLDASPKYRAELAPITIERLEKLVGMSLQLPYGEVHTLQHFLMDYLQTKDGQLVAEQLVGLLTRFPARGDPAPIPPKFPFDDRTAIRYQREYAEWASLPLEFTSANGISYRLIPPGTFQMGSANDEPGHNSGGYDETLHQVTLTKPFYLSKHHTTVGQFRRFVEAEKYVTDVEKNGGGHAHDAKAEWKHREGTQWRKPGFAGPFEPKDNHPVVHVSWTDSKNFCAWLDKQSSVQGLTHTLPTEAQWEWACRAGSADRFWWGPNEDTSGTVVNCGDQALKKAQPEWPRAVMPMNDGYPFLAPVGSFQSNGFGLFDMLGNCWQFCGDRYAVYGKEPVTDPVGTDEKRGYCVRGGGWSNAPNDVRCASRSADPPHFGHSNLGFRVALVLPAPK